ncbi:hypothetical protein T265_02067 [Opisthorchis viverrini]|uniref:Fibronectin type-III domain-containing protein n=1 Tax=Opisthorchis viverrini TaxID=6198 RepID=A0A075AII5_OPIVI|nr:hypothetical protein T265_02067 [Opisthorchis viverrini]KER31694.1 hypothetical protein T265_02067 [Opisthorchis viverrini]
MEKVGILDAHRSVNGSFWRARRILSPIRKRSRQALTEDFTPIFEHCRSKSFRPEDRWHLREHMDIVRRTTRRQLSAGVHSGKDTSTRCGCLLPDRCVDGLQEPRDCLRYDHWKDEVFYLRLLIPLNLHVASTDADSVMLIWDEPECNEKMTQPDSEIKCLGKERIRSYQVMYRMIGESPVTEQIQSVDGSQESDPAEPDDNWLVTDTETNENELNDFKSADGSMHIINVTRTWARLDNLLPGCRYSAAVRAVGTGVEPNSDVLYSEWSMTELFETPRRGPEDAPADLQLTNMPTGSGPARIQISWQPPQRPHGQLVSYILYFTLNHSLPISKWSKRKLPANSLNTVLNGLHRGVVYFLHMRARNRHGNGPLSPVRLFRTPDASGQGGGEIPIGRNYPDAYSIPKDLLALVAPSDQEHTIRDVSVPAASNGTRWLFFGFVLGSIILLIVIVCALLIQRRRQIRLSASFG